MGGSGRDGGWRVAPGLGAVARPWAPRLRPRSRGSGRVIPADVCLDGAMPNVPSRALLLRRPCRASASTQNARYEIKSLTAAFRDNLAHPSTTARPPPCTLPPGLCLLPCSTPRCTFMPVTQPLSRALCLPATSAVWAETRLFRLFLSARRLIERNEKLVSHMASRRCGCLSGTQRRWQRADQVRAGARLARRAGGVLRGVARDRRPSLRRRGTAGR